MNRVSQRHPDQTLEPPQLVSSSDKKEWLWAPHPVGSNRPSSGETHLNYSAYLYPQPCPFSNNPELMTAGVGVHRCTVCEFRALPCGSAPSSPQQQRSACGTVDVSPHCLSMPPSIFPTLSNKTLWYLNLLRLWLEGLGGQGAALA